MNVTIVDPPIESEDEFHNQIARAFALPSHYGKNLDALWDVLTNDIPRPAKLVWLNSEASRKAMTRWNVIIQLLGDVAVHDRDRGMAAFELSLR